MPDLRRRRQYVKDVVAGLRDQRARSARPMPDQEGLGRRTPRRRPGIRPVLAGALFASALLLALTGSTIFLAGLFGFAALLWAIEDSDDPIDRRPPIVISGPAPAPVAPSGAVTEHPPPAVRPPDEPSEPAARPAPEPARRPSRGGATLSYEATLAELMALVGSVVTVDFEAAGGDRGRGVTASRLVGELASGSVDEDGDAHGGRGLFFGVGRGSGFYLPALDFVWAQRREFEVVIRLRTHSLSILTEQAQDPAQLVRATP